MDFYSKAFRKRHKLVIQTIALLLTVLAAAPVYVGLQQDLSGLAWTGMGIVVLGMAVGLWGS
jgi:hypothetical protein